MHQQFSELDHFQKKGSDEHYLIREERKRETKLEYSLNKKPKKSRIKKPQDTIDKCAERWFSLVDSVEDISSAASAINNLNGAVQSYNIRNMLEARIEFRYHQISEEMAALKDEGLVSREGYLFPTGDIIGITSLRKKEVDAVRLSFIQWRLNDETIGSAQMETLQEALRKPSTQRKKKKSSKNKKEIKPKNQSFCSGG